jgi:hypothetical protein
MRNMNTGAPVEPATAIRTWVKGDAHDASLP